MFGFSGRDRRRSWSLEKGKQSLPFWVIAVLACSSLRCFLAYRLEFSLAKASRGDNVLAFSTMCRLCPTCLRMLETMGPWPMLTRNTTVLGKSSSFTLFVSTSNRRLCIPLQCLSLLSLLPFSTLPLRPIPHCWPSHSSLVTSSRSILYFCCPYPLVHCNLSTSTSINTFSGYL